MTTTFLTSGPGVRDTQATPVLQNPEQCHFVIDGELRAVIDTISGSQNSHYIPSALSLFLPPLSGKINRHEWWADQLPKSSDKARGRYDEQTV